jgi:hypothetical protein
MILGAGHAITEGTVSLQMLLPYGNTKHAISRITEAVTLLAWSRKILNQDQVFEPDIDLEVCNS